VTERTVDLVQEGVDVAIHNGPVSDSTVVARKIAATPAVTVATPEHLARHDEPRSPSDLDGRECITFVSGGAAWPWRFKGKFGEIVHQPKGHLRTNDAEQIRAAVLAGLGLAHTPGWLFIRETATSRTSRRAKAGCISQCCSTYFRGASSVGRLAPPTTASWLSRRSTRRPSRTGAGSWRFVRS
jgi:DNA-binding transcriptional LysR family regulator